MTTLETLRKLRYDMKEKAIQTRNWIGRIHGPAEAALVGIALAHEADANLITAEIKRLEESNDDS